MKMNFKVLKPAAAGIGGFALANLINKIPTGAGKTVGDTAEIAGGVKIAVALFAPGLLGNKVPYVNEIAVGVAISGFKNLIDKFLPSVSSYVAAPSIGATYTPARGNIYNGMNRNGRNANINCAPTEASVNA